MSPLFQLVHAVFEWASRPAVLTVLFVSSGFSLVASIVALPWYLKRLPADYFVRRTTLRVRAPQLIEPTWTHSAFVLLKNIVGGLLVLAGLAMLVLPGQGVATIVVGLLMMQFPGKRRLERKLISIPPVLRAVNGMRVKNGQQPLLMPSPSLVPPLGAPHSEPHSVR